MAKRAVNKSEAIREVLNSMGWDTRTKDVIQTLAAKKIKVASAQVSNVKAIHAKKGGKSSGRAAKGSGNGTYNRDVLLRAKEMIEMAGSHNAAVAALELVAKLQ